MTPRHAHRPEGAHTDHPHGLRPDRARDAKRVRGSTERVVAAGIVTALAATMLTTTTAAAWLTHEFDHATVGVIDCATTTDYASTASGRFFSAHLASAPLEPLAEVDGVQVTVIDGHTDQVSPAGAISLGDHAYSNPLSASMLNGQLDIDLSSLLFLPLDTSVGVLNQYAQALTTGDATGASGAILDSGAVNLASDVTGPQAPSIATLSLTNVIGPILGAEGAGLIDGVTALDVRLGAVAGIATLDACVADYMDSLIGSLARDYLIGSLALRLDSALVADLVGTVDLAATAIESDLNGLTADTPGLVEAMSSELSGLLTGDLAALQVGSVDVSLVGEWDVSAVADVLNDTISDDSGLVEIDLASGLVTVDLAALVDPVNGLNGADPNTQVVINSAMISQLENAVSSALSSWAAQVRGAVDEALDTVTLTGSVAVTLQALGLDVVDVRLDLTGASLSSLLTNSAATPEAVITVDALSIVRCPPHALTNPLGYAVLVIVCPVLPALTTVMTDELQGVIASAVTTLVTAIATDLSSNLAGLTGVTTSPLVELLSRLTSGLLGDGGVASLLVNVQNDPLTGGPEPSDWVDIPTGQYDVAALRLGVLGLLGAGQDVDIVLATGSVGSNSISP